jgi:hypothetical protein
MLKHVPISSSVRLWAMSSVRVGMSIPYTLLKRTGGAALAKKTLWKSGGRESTCEMVCKCMGGWAGV